jgi:hypothetical protein
VENFHYGIMSNRKKKVGGRSVTVNQNSWNVFCYHMQLILGNVSIFKSTPIPVAGSFTVTAWIWNVAIYTADHK